jgi:outer membrane cobalamin receptor
MSRASIEDDLNTQRLSGAFTLDAAASWPLSGRLSIEARAENLFDAEVEAGISGDLGRYSGDSADAFGSG